MHLLLFVFCNMVFNYCSKSLFVFINCGSSNNHFNLCMCVFMCLYVCSCVRDIHFYCLFTIDAYVWF